VRFYTYIGLSPVSPVSGGGAGGADGADTGDLVSPWVRNPQVNRTDTGDTRTSPIVGTTSDGDTRSSDDVLFTGDPASTNGEVRRCACGNKLSTPDAINSGKCKPCRDKRMAGYDR